MTRPLAIAPAADATNSQRLQIELALDMASAGRPLSADAVRIAASAAGADLLFALPAPDGKGVTAVLRLRENEGGHSFLQILSADRGYLMLGENEMEAAALKFAQASLDVFQRMAGDNAIREPLAAAR